MDEKIFHFTESKGVGNDRQIAVKQSELNSQQKDLLLAEAVHRYQDLTPELQERFLRHIAIK